MSDNYYIDEIRKTHDRIAKECDYDPQKVLEHAQKAARDLGFVKA